MWRACGRRGPRGRGRAFSLWRRKGERGWRRMEEGNLAENPDIPYGDVTQYFWQRLSVNIQRIDGFTLHLRNLILGK